MKTAIIFLVLVLFLSACNVQYDYFEKHDIPERPHKETLEEEDVFVDSTDDGVEDIFADSEVSPPTMPS